MATSSPAPTFAPSTPEPEAEAEYERPGYVTMTDVVSVTTLVLQRADLPSDYEWADVDLAGGGVFVGLGGWGTGEQTCESKVGLAFLPSEGDEPWPITAFLSGDPHTFWDTFEGHLATQVIFPYPTEDEARTGYGEMVGAYEEMLQWCVEPNRWPEGYHAIAQVDFPSMGE